MRLLLDEMFSPAVVEQLRRRGHDVVGALERDDLRGLSDEALLELASAERRVVATHDVGDLSRLALRFQAEARDHQGIILISSRRFRATTGGIGALVRALDAALKSHPGDDDLVNQQMWLRAPARVSDGPAR